MSNPLRWGTNLDAQVKPPAPKRDAGHQAGRPEAAQYENWWKDLAARSMERVALAFMAVENDVPNMSVRVLAGAIFNGAALTEVAEQVVGPFTAPTSNSRVDLIHVDRITGAAGVVAGAEAEIPLAPALPLGKIPVALVTLAVGQAAVTAQHIADIRTAYGIVLPVEVPSTDALVKMGNTGTLSTLAAPPSATSLLQATSGGALSYVTTLPSGLTIPGAAITGATGTFTALTGPVGGILGSNPLLHVRDEKAAGTVGGTFTNGAWRTRVLNTVRTNQIVGASLAANQITLPTGRYLIWARAPAREVNLHKLKLANITDASDVIIGSSTETPNSGAVAGSTDACLFGEFALTDGPKVLELRHRCSVTFASVGFGVPSNFDVVEVYADVMIWQLEAA